MHVHAWAMLVTLYQLFIFSLPFSAIAGIPVFGELTEQLSTYSLILTAPFFVLTLFQQRSPVHIPPLLLIFVFCLFVPILTSFLVNLPSITETTFHGRTALNKVFTSTLVLLFGLYAAYLTYFVFVHTKGDIKRILIKPLLASFLVTFLYAIPEVLAWYSPSVRSVYLTISGIIHSNQTFIETPFRLRSVGSEPSFIGIYFTFLLPWLLVARVYCRQRILINLCIIIAICMVLLTASRTAYAALLLIIVSWIYVGYFMQAHTPKRMAALALQAPLLFPLFILLMILILTFDTTLIEWVNQSDNLSNLTRLATYTAAFETFKQNILFGTGFGLTGYYLWPHMPDWGFWSYEIINYLETDRSGQAPPIYSMFVRIAGDLGLLGLLGWYGFWSYSLINVIKAAQQDVWQTGKRPWIAIGLVVSIMSFLALDISTGSFRLMNYWVTLGMITYYLQHIKLQRYA